MHVASESSTPEDHRVSPKGIYEIRRRHMSLALGGVKDAGPWGGGHPFDVELARIPPGKIGYPFHSHAAQTEYDIVLEGNGLVRDGNGQEEEIQAADHFIYHPGMAHQVVNHSDADLVYYVIADQHRADVTTYPHTGKRQIKPEHRYLRIEDVDYHEGEE